MKYILTIITMLYCFNTYAQRVISQDLSDCKCVDTSRFEIRYTFKFKRYSTDKHFVEDVRIIQVGKNVVKDFSAIIFHYDSLNTEGGKKGLSAVESGPDNIFPYEIYSYIHQKRRNEKYRMPLSAGTLCYPSEWVDLKWTVCPDNTIKLLGYTCNKATTIFAGRKYTAWYTLDVPVPYGPYKFFGLPGLIIKLEDESGTFVWEFCSISKKNTNIYIYNYELEQNCSYQSATRTIKRLMTNPMAFLQSVGVKMVVKQRDGSWGAPTITEEKYPYEPLELK